MIHYEKYVFNFDTKNEKNHPDVIKFIFRCLLWQMIIGKHLKQ